jgi:hypothetical protein
MPPKDSLRIRLSFCSTDNLFQSLEERTLTDDEQRIIEQRVRASSARAAPCLAAAVTGLILQRRAASKPLCPASDCPAAALPCPVQVALQRRMYEEYERRERQRKVAEVLEVCPDLTEKQAGAALDLCDGRCGGCSSKLVC